MSYLPVFVNAGAFVMFVATPFAKRFKYNHSGLMSVSMMTVASYQAIADLAGKFISQSLSKNPYYEAACFFACFAGYCGLAKLLDKGVGELLKTPERKPVESTVESKQEALKKEEARVPSSEDLSSIPNLIADTKRKFEQAKSMSEEPKFILYMNELSKVLGYMPENLIETLNKKLTEIEIRHTSLCQSNKSNITPEAELGVLLRDLEAFIKEPATSYVIWSVEAILANRPIQIDAAQASLIECHKAIKAVLDKGNYRETQVAGFKNTKQQLRTQFGPAMYVDENETSSMAAEMGNNPMGQFLLEAMQSSMKQAQSGKAVVAAINQLANFWKEIVLLESAYNGFMKGLGHSTASDNPPAFAELKENQEQYIRKIAELVTKKDADYLNQQTHVAQFIKTLGQSQGMGLGGPVDNDLDVD